eukprot:TRINITY_DN76476_c0_g1_i1.p1 TRINITY_DN76476_c0_g1~~TRINITY_DN76476_c0_g1_i1.p1  ORF type:complete len:361 (+),score=43.98 TRINITY_DN76476_c0_g1_i1:75-1085(+)
MASCVHASSLVSMNCHATFTDVQDFLDFPAVYALLCCSHESLHILQDMGIFESSARRRALIEQIPPYIDFRWRLVEDVEDVGQLPDVPSEILEEAARVDIAELEPSPAADGLDVPVERQSAPLTAMQLAKLTFFFVKGYKAYEARHNKVSEACLEEAVALAAHDDILLARLGDTCYARYQELAAEASEGEELEKLRVKTSELYQRAIRINPRSSYGFNGMSLFQEDRDRKKKYLLRAVALNDRNSYALVNLSMCLREERDSGRSTHTSLWCLALLRRALAINPNLFYARITAAELHLKLGQYVEAHQMLAEHLSRRPEDHQWRVLFSQLGTILRLS